MILKTGYIRDITEGKYDCWELQEVHFILIVHNISTTFGQRVNGDKGEMAMLVSRFSAGVIATMDIDNPKIKAVGMKPWSGVLFKVYWWMLVCIPPSLGQ